MKINQVVNESPQLCPECGGPAFADLVLAEKKDACYSKVRSRYKVWPSAYASGALVQCRKKGAANWGNKSESAAADQREPVLPSTPPQPVKKRPATPFGPNLKPNNVQGATYEGIEGGVAGSLADQFAAMARARGMNVRRAGTPDEERARTQQKLAQRAAEREAADKEAAEQDFAKLPELKAEYQELQAKYDALGGNRWQYADREQNLTDREREARGIEPKLNQLAGRIARAEKSQGVAEDVNTGPQIIYATGPRTMGVNDVDLVFKNLRTGKIVAHVVGNNYHPGDDRLQEFAPPEGGGDGDGDGNQPKTANYEIRMNNSKQPTYLALGDPQQDSKHEVYRLVSGKTDGPTYYGMGMTLVSNLDWWNFLEKMLGDIMWEDDAIEAGLVARKDNGDLVFLNKQQGVAEMDKSAPQPGRDGRVSHSTYGSRDKKGSDYFKGKEAPGKAIKAKQASKDALDILKKQGVAEGWEELRRRSKELATEWQKFNSTLEQKMKGMFIPLPTYKGRWGAPSMVANTGDRIVALAKINGVHVPFYISTGQGGKVNVPTGKWYPFFGISDSGWFNKGSEEDILKYYGSSKLKGVAEWLNNNVGNLMALGEEKDFFPVFDQQKTTQAINQDLSPPPRVPSTKDAFKKPLPNGQEIFNQLNKQFEENVNNILIRIGSEPYYKNTEKKSDTTNAPMRVPTAVPSIPVTGKEITGPLTLSFNGKQFTVFNISGNLGRANVKQLGDDYKFWSDNQFELKRDSKDGTWVLVPNMAATNKTMINGNAATSPTKLKQGMVIAVGNPEKKIQKLPITVGEKVVAEGLNEFATGGGDDGDDGFSEETLKRLAAQWYNGDEDPRVERTLAAAGWEIGWDEGYDDEPGVFVVQAGDVNGNSYISWPAHELKQGVAEGDISQLEKDVADAPVKPIANMESATDSNGYAVDREDAGEYDYEGDQAKDQLRTIVAAARKLDGILDDNENMPEWVQMKITKATDYLDTAADYVAANKAQSEPMGETRSEKIGGRHAPADFDSMIARLKQLAGSGPLKTAYDPQKRVYKNVPTAVQPRDKK